MHQMEKMDPNDLNGSKWFKWVQMGPNGTHFLEKWVQMVHDTPLFGIAPRGSPCGGRSGAARSGHRGVARAHGLKTD